MHPCFYQNDLIVSMHHVFIRVTLWFEYIIYQIDFIVSMYRCIYQNDLIASMHNVFVRITLWFECMIYQNDDILSLYYSLSLTY